MTTPGVHPALPLSAAVDDHGILHVGRCRVTDLALEFGTPLYIFDVLDIRERIAQCAHGLGAGGALHYAAKAYLSTWLIRLLTEYDAGIDVCSAVELAIAMHAGMRAERVRVHGNNKSPDLLRTALRERVGAIVVDNIDELHDLIAIAKAESTRAPILLRLNPGIEAHTHRYLQTGILDSKFGIPIAHGQARSAVLEALSAGDAVELLGYHAHIGTQILTLEPYNALVDTLLDFASGLYAETQYWPAQISPGGGVGITYTDEAPLPLQCWAANLRERLQPHGNPSMPHLSVELGRSIIGSSGVALYTAGYTKHIPGVRSYLCVDGGMADNIRPALYKAQYTALAAERMHDALTHTVTLAGPYCESGDILIESAMLPEIKWGDLIAVPAAGAYCLPMSSNYNGALRPAVVSVENSEARLVQRRQRVDDLLSIEALDA